LGEGYVMARIMPDHDYCAFDIHLWSSFEKHESIKKALTSAVGGESLSSFRIVAGGMFGVSTWKDDIKNRGPRSTQACDHRHEASIRDDSVEKSTIDHVLEGFVTLVTDDGLSVAVLCGEDLEACRSLRVLEEQENIGDIIPLWCPHSMDISKEEKGGKNMKLTCELKIQMTDCEKEMVRTLSESMSKGNLGAIVVDSSASEATAMILYRISSLHTNAFAQNFLVVSAMSGEIEIWRRNFVRKFLKDVFYREPAYNAEVLFTNLDASVGVDITSSGDFHFIQKLKNLSRIIEAKINFTSDIQEIMGGFWLTQEDFEASNPFGFGDYNISLPIKQWASQKPLGYQNIFQFESSTKNLSAPQIRKALDCTLANMSPSLMPSNEIA